MSRANTLLQAPSQARRSQRLRPSASQSDDQPRLRSTSRHEDRVAPEETEQERIDRLGRERPPQFSSTFAEVAFVYSIVMSQLTSEYFVSGFNILLPTLMGKFDIPASAAVWPSGAFALVTAAFLLPFGRVADMLGGYVVYMFGLTWFTLWSLVGGFSQNMLMLIFCRALQGLGPAAFLPSGVMLMGSIYRPGPRKNLVFAIYGGSAPLGFFIGVLMAGLVGSFLEFGWYFWIGALLILTTIVAAFFAVPSDRNVQRQVEADWLGMFLFISGMILTVFALTDGSHAPNKWATPYVAAALAVGLALLAAAYYVEGYVARNPLLPFDFFKTPYIKPLFAALFFSYGCLGVFLLYATLYMTDIMGATPVQVAAWFVPMCVGGVLLSLLGGYILHLVSGTVLVCVSGCGWIVSSLLFALEPVGASYWAYVFPAMIGATVGIDITFNVANVFITTSLSSRMQGLAGGLMHSLLYLGIAFFLAFADVTQTETSSQGQLGSYRAVFWFLLAISGVALAIMALFVRLPKAESDFTADERAALMEGRGSVEIELHNMPSRQSRAR